MHPTPHKKTIVRSPNNAFYHFGASCLFSSWTRPCFSLLFQAEKNLLQVSKREKNRAINECKKNIWRKNSPDMPLCACPGGLRSGEKCCKQDKERQEKSSDFRKFGKNVRSGNWGEEFFGNWWIGFSGDWFLLGNWN